MICAELNGIKDTHSKTHACPVVANANLVDTADNRDKVLCKTILSPFPTKKTVSFVFSRPTTIQITMLLKMEAIISLNDFKTIHSLA
jgi:hypothetical protein